MRAGKFDKRIKIQGLTPTNPGGAEDAFGAPVEDFTDTAEDAATVWGMVEYGSGGERRVAAAQEQANLPVTVTVRYSTLTRGIVPLSHRLYFDGKEWDIESAAPVQGRPAELVIIARARIGA